MSATAQTVESALGGIVREFIERCGRDVEGVIVTRSDGLLIHAQLPAVRVDEKLLSAMVALITGTSKRICKELGRGTLNTIIVESSEGKVLIKPVAVGELREIYVGVLTNPEPNLGLILIELERIIEKIREILR